jgi:hypothetical protein
MILISLFYYVKSKNFKVLQIFNENKLKSDQSKYSIKSCDWNHHGDRIVIN